MPRRHPYILLALVMGLSAPLGCKSWECFAPPMFVQQPPVANVPVTGELTPAQAAQLCMSAGEALEKKGFTAQAIQQYENARAHDPQAHGVARRLAILYDLQGDASRAETEYGRALQEQIRDPELLNDFGYFHYRHNRLQVAENWLRIAVTVDPNCRCAWVNLGQVLACQGRVEDSFQAFAHVLRPGEAYSNVGVTLAKQGKNAEARQALEKALALDPGLQQPRAFLNALTGTPGPLPPGITSTAPPANLAHVKPTAPTPPAPTARVMEKPRPALPMRPPAQALFMPATVNPAPVVPASTLLAPRPAPYAPSVASSDLPSIVSGPIRPTPLAARPAMLTQTMPAPASPLTSSSFPHKAPPAPPPPPPPPPAPPAAARNEEGPVLIRTSFIEFDMDPAPAKLDLPRPLPVKPASSPLPEKPPATTPNSSAPPRAVLTDCQSEPEPAAPK